MTNNDADLVQRVRQGDRKAFAMLVERYEKPIFNLAYRMVRDPDDAADITQNAFVKAYLKLDSYLPSYKFFNWLYRIAVNEAINLLNRNRRFREYASNEQAYGRPAYPKTPDEDYQLSEMSELLGRALEALNPDHRTVIILKHLLLLSYRDIATILEIPGKTVKSRLYSARQALRTQLVEQGYTR
jgi:RNA polymerase sigma-70 factor (ECF subfamily)